MRSELDARSQESRLHHRTLEQQVCCRRPEETELALHRRTMHNADLEAFIESYYLGNRGDGQKDERDDRSRVSKLYPESVRTGIQPNT